MCSVVLTNDRRIPPNHRPKLTMEQWQRGCDAENGPHRQGREMSQLQWPWARQPTRFDRCSSGKSMRNRWLRDLKKAREKGDLEEEKRIYVDRMLFTLYNWSTSSKNGSTSLIKYLHEEKGCIKIREFIPQSYRDLLRKTIPNLAKQLPGSVKLKLNVSHDQIWRIDVPVLNSLARNIGRPVGKGDLKNSTVDGVEFEGAKDLEFFGDLLVRAFPQHHYAEISIIRNVETKKGWQECDEHLDRPIQVSKNKGGPGTDTLDRALILSIPCDGRLPLVFTRLQGRKGGRWKERDLNANSQTGDLVLMSMRTWHKTGRPDRTKDGKAVAHWRLYIRIAKRKKDLLEYSNDEKEKDGPL